VVVDVIVVAVVVWLGRVGRVSRGVGGAITVPIDVHMRAGRVMQLLDR